MSTDDSTQNQPKDRDDSPRRNVRIVEMHPAIGNSVTADLASVRGGSAVSSDGDRHGEAEAGMNVVVAVKGHGNSMANRVVVEDRPEHAERTPPPHNPADLRSANRQSVDAPDIDPDVTGSELDKVCNGNWARSTNKPPLGAEAPGHGLAAIDGRILN